MQTPRLGLTDPGQTDLKVLLTGADLYGNLGAARWFGSRGHAVTIADSRRLVPAIWSKYVERQIDMPDMAQPERCVANLVDFGTRHPRHLVYPASDEMAWLIASFRDRLAGAFDLYCPSLQTIATLLNKRRLHAACQASQLAVPDSWFPDNSADVARLAHATLPFPILIKPQTQAFLQSRTKGIVAYDGQSLVRKFQSFVDTHPYLDWFSRAQPEQTIPVLQRYHSEAEDSIYHLAGFIDRSGDHFVVLGARKVLQRPRKLGIGLCFDAAPVDRDLAERLRLFCQRVGYFGVFEVEFIVERATGRHLLSDFNPRFYSQMAFDLERGLPLIQMLMADTQHQEELLQKLRTDFHGRDSDDRQSYCHSFIFWLTLYAQRLSGRLTRVEYDWWRRWYTSRPLVDAVADRRDRLPSVIDKAYHILHFLKHPRYFCRAFFLNQ